MTVVLSSTEVSFRMKDVFYMLVLLGQRVVGLRSCCDARQPTRRTFALISEAAESAML